MARNWMGRMVMMMMLGLLVMGSESTIQVYTPLDLKRSFEGMVENKRNDVGKEIRSSVATFGKIPHGTALVEPPQSKRL